MLTCITMSKQPGDDCSPGQLPDADAGSKNPSEKSITSQLKDMALKASGAYRGCAPCGGPPAAAGRMKGRAESDQSSWSYRRQGSSGSSSSYYAGQRFGWGKGGSSGETTPRHGMGSGRRDPPGVVFVEEKEPKEWIAQVEPGVLIDFLSLPGGGNDLKRIRFSRDMFNKFQAQKWWTEHYDRVMELYNVQRLNRQAFPLPMAPRSEDEGLKLESTHDSPITPPVGREPLPRNLLHPVGTGMDYLSSDSLDHLPGHPRVNRDSTGVASTPKLSSISGTKMETSSMETSFWSSSSRDADRSSELSISTASDLETEWVEQDEPGVYITIRALAGGKRELRRVRFSRERFGEVHARLWWEENRARIHERYL
ncbi:hypothetical protein MLD38_014261 [Melastoma candidum]|uniref:Uncharacterized protein n=1 Tax=Melastoma candidum TaxID=119954 RepID=A0ACB9RDD9_9MYRT|nr:hypothetical protein MLD38_014261 [Melastoma candidum]